MASAAISLLHHFPSTVKFSSRIKATISTTTSVAPLSISNPTWQWKFDGTSVNIHVEKVEKKHVNGGGRTKNILMVPTISDVSTVEEWRRVVDEITNKDDDDINWNVTMVDWPGLGYSDRPKLDYTADVMERFLVDFVSSSSSPFTKDNEYLVVGGGHAATIAIRATSKGLLKPKAIAAVAPTWAGPLPIVFGRDSSMESRYGLLRGTLRSPALGWLMYNALVSNKKSIRSQYQSHVYANPENVTPTIVESRYELTTRNGARYVPAAFLTGLLDPVNSREEFVQLFAGLEGIVPVLVLSTSGSPKRSKAEMEALKGVKGVKTYMEVPGALLPQEEYPQAVAEELYKFMLQHLK